MLIALIENYEHSWGFSSGIKNIAYCTTENLSLKKIETKKKGNPQCNVSRQKLTIKYVLKPRSSFAANRLRSVKYYYDCDDDDIDSDNGDYQTGRRKENIVSD